MGQYMDIRKLLRNAHIHNGSFVDENTFVDENNDPYTLQKSTINPDDFKDDERKGSDGSSGVDQENYET